MTDFDNYTQEAVELLMRMIRIPSLSRDEGQVADMLFDHLKKLNLHPQREGNNLWCVAPGYDAKRPTLLMDAHIDTVKPASSWTRDPFMPTLEDDCLYGLGSNDDGGSVVSMLQAFRILSSTPQPYNLIFSASCEEEVSGKNGFELMLSKLPPIDVALVGEPTDMQPAVAEKGLMVLDVTATGKSGHAARNEGVNAIYKAIQDIEWFQHYQFAEVSPMLGPVKMSVTVIQAGTQHNVIPDKCTFVVDIRSNEMYTNQQLYDEIVEHTECEVKARSYRLNSSHIAIDHPLVQRILQAGKTAFGSPTLSNQTLMPFPSVKMGPGSSSRSHTANEFIKISEIREAIEQYVTILNELKIN